MILSLNTIYIIAGVVLLYIGLVSCRDVRNKRRWSTGAFWGLYGLTFLLGNSIPAPVMGVIVLLIAALAGFGGVTKGHYDERSYQERFSCAAKLRNWVFLPPLLIPAITVLGSTVFAQARIAGIPWLDPKNQTVVSLGFAGVVALVIGLVITRETPARAMNESRRLMDAIGWAVLFPQMLTTLGAIFAVAGIGKAIFTIFQHIIPAHNVFVVVVVYCVGLCLLTIIMGGGYASLPIMTTGIAIPFLIHLPGVQPNALAALGMFAAYSGTLTSPMAATFNIVPAALLELPDKYQVIKVQAPTAIVLLAANIIFMYFLALHGGH